MNPIRILTTSPSIDPSNNVSGIANLTKLWIENNENVEYFLFKAGKPDSTDRNLRWLCSQASVLLSFIRIVQKNRKKIDIVHINMPQEELAIIRDSFFAHVATRLDKPMIVHIRGGKYSQNPNTPLFYKRLVKQNLDTAARVIVLGDKEKRFFQEHYDICPKKIHVLPNCVDVPEYPHREISSTANLNITFMGRLDKNKGLAETIDALAQLPPKIKFTFNVAGDGPDKEFVTEQCELKLEGKFVYHGIVSGINKSKLLLDSHIFILPSYYEGLPNALLEAMSYGSVPIVSPVGSIQEVVQNKINGLLVSPKNVNAIVQAILYLYKSPDKYIRFSKNAYETIKNKYSLTSYLAALNRIYHDLL